MEPGLEDTRVIVLVKIGHEYNILTSNFDLIHEDDFEIKYDIKCTGNCMCDENNVADTCKNLNVNFIEHISFLMDLNATLLYGLFDNETKLNIPNNYFKNRVFPVDVSIKLSNKIKSDL